MAERYFITGATGAVGSALTEYLAKDGNEIVVLARDPQKATELFSHLGNVSIIAGVLGEPITYEGDVNYIIHSGAPTDSRFFVDKPVETIDAIILGTKSVLEFARQKNVTSLVNLSSMEVYGTPTNEEDLSEEKQFYLDPLNVRSNYPLAKRLGENMVVAYTAEYGVPAKNVRLAQVLSKRLLPGDNRVIAQFIRAAKSGMDIELATDGTTKQTYVSMDDAISGILTVLHKGENAQSYNIANESTYCSIREVAELVAQKIAKHSIQVKINTGTNDGKYPPVRTLRVNSSKLRALGWSPVTSLEQALMELAG